MALTSQDFLHGVDFTTLPSGTAANHNQLIDQATPVDDSLGSFVEGKGIIITTVDSALDTPIVPNPNFDIALNKWKLYFWCRKPHVSSTSFQPLVYAWNENAVSDAIFLKWRDIGIDTSAMQAQINAALADADSAKTTAENANTTANNAATQAAASVVTANNANTTATNAATNATTALTNASTAQTTANNASVQANAALAAANAKKSPNSALTPGTAGQEIRTNTAATSAEWFSRVDTYVKVSETQNKSIDGGDAVNGKNTRDLNTEDNDTGGLAALSAGMITLQSGTYHCNITVIGRRKTNQAFLVRDSDDTVLLTGTSFKWADGDENVPTHINGVITLATATVLRVDHYFESGTPAGFGKAANLHPDVAGKEVYLVAEFWKIG